MNNKSIDIFLSENTGDKSLIGLYPALGNALIWENESKLIWELVEKSEGTQNVPILLCPDDLDFSCTIICAKVTIQNQSVHWEKIGRVNGDNYNLQEELASGILRTDKWSVEDWKEYGGSLAWCKVGDIEWRRWVSDNWDDEQKRRLNNYTYPFLQDDSNIEWFNVPKLVFSVEDYFRFIESFREELSKKSF